MRRSIIAGLIAAALGSLLAWADGINIPFSFPATTCTNQFIRSIAAATGIGTCATVSLTADVTGTLPVANGGTGDTGTAWSSWTPTITCNSGAPTTITADAVSKTLGKTTWVSITFTATNIGTCTQALNFTLPNTAAKNSTFTVVNINTVTGKNASVAAGTSSVSVYGNGLVFPAANGEAIYLNGVYTNQ